MSPILIESALQRSSKELHCFKIFSSIKSRTLLSVRLFSSKTKSQQNGKSHLIVLQHHLQLEQSQFFICSQLFLHRYSSVDLSLTFQSWRQVFYCYYNQRLKLIMCHTAWQCTGPASLLVQTCTSPDKSHREQRQTLLCPVPSLQNVALPHREEQCKSSPAPQVPAARLPHALLHHGWGARVLNFPLTNAVSPTEKLDFKYF